MKTDAPRAEHFLLVGHQGSHNRGCEALVRTAIDVLRRNSPDSLIAVASMYPEHDVPLLDVEQVRIIPGITRLPRLHCPGSQIEERPRASPRRRGWIRRLTRGTLPYGLVTWLRRRRREKNQSGPIQRRPEEESGFTSVLHLKKAMLDADIVISIGGDLFIEDYGPPIYALESLEFAQFLERKTVVWGASIWQLKTKWIEERMKLMLDRCNLVTVRDSQSVEYLHSLGVINNVTQVADGAFLLAPKCSARAALPWRDRPSCVVGFNGSHLLTHFLPSERCQGAITGIVAFLRDIIDTQGCNVVLVPHDAYPGAPERDFLFEVEQAIDRGSSVYLPPIGLSAQETKALIGQCDLFVGMRFHPTIASLSQYIPTLGISHSPKFAGLHDVVYGHRDFLVTYEDISYETMSRVFRALQADQGQIRHLLARRIPELQAAALSASDSIKGILASY